MKRAGLMLPVLLAGCAIPKEPVALAPAAAPQLGLATAPTPAIDAEWWRSFGDPQLDRIVADALANNPTLAVGAARVRQAQAALSARTAENGPDVTADVNPQVARFSGRYEIPPPYAGKTYFVGTALANLNWTLDLFGRQRDAITAARASAQAAALDIQATRLTLAGAVAQTYISLARADAQAAIAQNTVAARQRSLNLVEVRIRNRLASKLDEQAAATLLSQAREAVAAAAGERAVATAALAALAGRGVDYAAGIGPTKVSLSALPQLPGAVPADLLARRPDLLAAQARIAASAASREVARKAFYPNVNLVALAGLEAIGLGNFFNPDAGTAGAGAAIHLPIFENGRLRAELAGATAGEDLAIADYNDRVLAAVRDAAQALGRIRSVDAERAQAQQVVRGFSETARLNNVRVASGLESRLDLVDTDIRLLDAQLDDTNLAADGLNARVQLVLALGGGFTPQQGTPS